MSSTLELMDKIERDAGSPSDTLSLMDRIEKGDSTDTLSLMDRIASGEQSAPPQQDRSRGRMWPAMPWQRMEAQPAPTPSPHPPANQPPPWNPDVGPPPGRAPLRPPHPADIARSRVGREVERYEEENPPMTRLGQRLESGVYNLAQAGQGVASINYGDILNAFDALDAGADIRSIGPQGPNKAQARQGDPVWNAALTYHRAAPEERARMRAGLEQNYNEATGGVAKYASKSAEIPRNPAALAAMQADSFEGFWDNFTVAPIGVLAQIGVESLPTMAPGLALGAAGGAVTGPAGFASGLGTGSAATEFGLSIADKLQDLGADLSDPESVQKVLRENSEEVRKFASRRAMAIGLFDAASGGLAATRILPRAGIPSHIAEAATQLGAQAGLGGGGEAAGQYAAGQEFRPGEIAAEAIGELTTGPAEIGGAMISGARGNAPVSPPEARTEALETTPRPAEEAPAPTQPPETDDLTPSEPEAPNEPQPTPPEAPAEPEPAPSPPNVPEPEAGKPIAVVVDGSEYDVGGPVPTAPADPGRTGTLGNAVARTATRLENILREADAKRNEPQLTPEQKKAANQVKTDVLNALDTIEMNVAQSQYGDMVSTARQQAERWTPNARKSDWKQERAHYVQGFTDAAMGSVAAAMESNIPSYKVGVREGKKFIETRGPVKPQNVHLGIVRVTGSKATFSLPADPNAIAALRKRIEMMRDERFYSQDPGQQTLAAMDRVQGMAPPGENYRGMVADKVEGAMPETPIRRENILRDFVTGIGMPIYQGRIKKGKMLGYFRPSVSEVRIKNMNDIEVAAHEMAHLIDKQFPEIRKRWMPATNANRDIRAELRGVSYDQSKLYEGFAEAVRLWMTQPDEAAARAPKFFGWWEDYITGHPYEKALRKAQQDMTAWFNQDAVSRARSKIGVTQDINAGLTKTRDRFRQAVADDLHGIYQMEREMTGGIASLGPYEKARTSRAAHSIAEGVLLYGTLQVNRDGSHSFAGKSLQDILAPVSERMDGFLMYAVGRSAHELMSQGREKLFTKAEIKGMLALETPEFREAFANYQAWNRGIVDFAQAKGLINPSFRRAWRRAAYLPFHRVGTPGSFTPNAEFKGIKALTGGTDNIRDVLQNIINNSTTLIQAALINEARIDVANLARREGGARWMAKIPSEEKAVKIHREEIRRALLESLGVKRMNQLTPELQVIVDRMIDNMEPMAALVTRGNAPFGLNVVTVLRNGEPEYWEVIDPLLYRSMVALKRQRRNAVLNFLSITRRFRQSMITLTTDFISKNLFRDTLMATVMSRHGFIPLLDSMRGLKSRLAVDEDYKNYVANGGGMASYLLDEDSYRAHMEAFYQRQGFRKGSVLHGLKEMTFFVGRIADAVEMSARLGEYKRALARGEHPRHAAYSGREVSTDFAMRGDHEYLQYLYDGAMFTKAMMNGIDRYYRGLAHDPNKARIAVLTATFATAVLAIHAMNRHDDDIADEYMELPDWERDFFIHFYVPNEAMLRYYAGLGPKPPKYERFHHFRAPTVWEVGSIASITTRAYDGFVDEQPAEAAGHIGRIVADQFSAGLMPAVAEPVVESFFNYRFFTGRPIESEGIRDLPPYMRGTPGTPRTIRALGEMQKGLPRELQLSPARIEALLDGYFNSWGTYGLTLADQMIYDDAPDMRFEDIPGVGVFYRPTPPRATKSQEQFYKFLREATEARAAIRDLAFKWREDEARAGTGNFWAQQHAFLSSQNEAMIALRRLRDRASYAPDLESLQELVEDSMAVSPLFAADVDRLRKSDAWSDVGALKKRVGDVIAVRRNELLKTAVGIIEERRQAQ